MNEVEKLVLVRLNEAVLPVTIPRGDSRLRPRLPLQNRRPMILFADVIRSVAGTSVTIEILHEERAMSRRIDPKTAGPG